MLIETEGLVIMEKSVGENDRLITVLTRQEGVVRAFAQQAKKIKNNKLSATQLLSYSRFTIFKGREKYIIDDAQPIEVFLTCGVTLNVFPLPNIFVSWLVRWLPKRLRLGIFCV